MRARTTLIAALLALFVLGGCTRAHIGFSATHTPTIAPTKTPTVTPSPTVVVNKLGVEPEALSGVSIKLWHAWPSPQKELLEAQIVDFNRSNEWGLIVRAVPFLDYPTLFDAVSGAFGTEDAPDLIVALPEQIRAWDGQKMIVDLTDYLNDPKLGLDISIVSDIPDVIWAQDQELERHLALPAERSMRLMAYNRQWASELGFNVPPETDAAFEEQVCAANASFKTDTILSNDGFGGWMVDTDRQTVLSWLAAFGGGVTGEGGYAFETEENIAALSFMKTLFDDGCAWTYTGEYPRQPFINRQALFMALDLSELDYFAQLVAIAGSEDEWSVTGFPGPEGSFVTVYGPSYAIFKNTPEKQLAAWLFARSTLSVENQELWVKATGLLPLRTSVAESLAGYAAATRPHWGEAVKLMDSAVIEPPLPSWRTVKYVLDDATRSIFRMGIPVQDIPDILFQMQTTAEDLSKK